MNEKDVKQGYVYHIKNAYFETVKDDKLLRNHEGGGSRPTYLCLKDNQKGLLWVIPMSSQIAKYQGVVARDTAQYGKCLKVFIGEYANRQNAFLFQNMFPILPKYFDHVHVIRQNATPVSQRLQSILDRNFRDVLRLHKQGTKLVFPDINRLEKLMLEELDKDRMSHQPPATEKLPDKKLMAERIAEAATRAKECNAAKTKPQNDRTAPER